MKVANQKLITIMPSEKETPYHTFTEKELCTACDLLRDSGIALTIYLVYASQKENYTILTGVNQLKLRGINGISANGYREAMKKLKGCGYITPGKEKDHLLFWRIPQKIADDNKTDHAEPIKKKEHTDDNISSAINNLLSNGMFSEIKPIKQENRPRKKIFDNDDLNDSFCDDLSMRI